jgi:S1-C subfamily serine protease
VVGIIVAKVEGVSIEGIGFAIAINDVQLVLTPLKNGMERRQPASVVSQRKIYNDLATIDCKEIIEP